MRIGILALQGGFIEHAEALKKAGAESFLIRQRRDLEQPIDGLILPGGESTVMSRLLHTRDLFTPLREKLLQGLPVFGTCAGLILLAREIEGEEQSHLGVLPLTVKRNGYGRQLGSFHTTGEFLGIGTVPMSFIRAPQITTCDKGINPVAWHEGMIIAGETESALVCTFHPELTSDVRIHTYFLNKILRLKQ